MRFLDDHHPFIGSDEELSDNDTESSDDSDYDQHESYEVQSVSNSDKNIDSVTVELRDSISKILDDSSEIMEEERVFVNKSFTPKPTIIDEVTTHDHVFVNSSFVQNTATKSDVHFDISQMKKISITRTEKNY